MKTIFDKVDPKYIDCTAGTCEHAIHQPNAALWVLIAVLTLAAIKLYKPNRQ